MKRKTRLLALALVATLAVTGCGEDNNDNDDNDNTPTATRTATPAAPVPTATPTAGVNPTETPTPDGSPGTQTPTPASTSTGAQCEGEALNVTVTSQEGSDLDTGWTGIAHNSVAIREASVTAALDCPGGGPDCTVDGSALVGTKFGSPLPLSAGGVSSCVVNEFREAITGTYDCETGCGSSDVRILSSVYLVIDQNKPCPPCVGDPTPNDGDKGGTCDGGATPGAACDVGGISDLFQNAGGAPPDAGRTSNDCIPSGSPVGRLNIDLNPLTTDTVSQTASVNCLSAAFPPGSCFCPGQVQPNACIPDGVCPASGVCEQNPPDGVCSGQTFRSCILANPPQQDCEDIAPGAGNCQPQNRPCFDSTISRTGVCGTEEGTLVSIFCIPATNAPAINTVAGLPGPGAVALPSSQVRTPR